MNPLLSYVSIMRSKQRDRASQPRSNQACGLGRQQAPLHKSPRRNLAAMIKTAASAASPKTKSQESWRASGQRLGMRTAGTARLSWILVFEEAALATGLLMAYVSCISGCFLRHWLIAYASAESRSPFLSYHIQGLLNACVKVRTGTLLLPPKRI